MDDRDNRGLQIVLGLIAAAAVGFVIALVVMNRDDNGDNANATVSQTTSATTVAPPATGTTSTTTATTGPTGPAPTQGVADFDSCLALWNEPNNRAAQTFMANIASNQSVRINVGASAQVPPKCLVTVIGNNGDVSTFAEGGGTTFPYAPSPGRGKLEDLPASQRQQNALEQPDGTLKPKS